MGFINFFLFFSLLTNIVVSTPIDLNQLNIGVWLSGAAYCGKEKYKSMRLDGPAMGFVYRETLYDVKTDLQGYIGTLSSSKAIYVVLRGSSSTMNWLDDFEVKQVPYTTFPECNCKVHNGFYRSALGVKNKTVDTVKALKTIYPAYSVVVTGHSYGAACAQLLAMELKRVGIDIKLYDYGQPRVGDSKYADFVNTEISEHYRATHNRDIVPHVPPTDVFGYLHSCREVFENSDGFLNICSETKCEDPKCADQFSLIQTNGDDHEVYLKHRVSCVDSTY
jgi:hypothetical protein